MNRKQIFKVTAKTIGILAVLFVCVVGGLALRSYLREKRTFAETSISGRSGERRLGDTTFCVNGVEIKMIGVGGGTICCKGMYEPVELSDFYIGETEVTQELWTAIMGDNPSIMKDSVLCPVENVDLEECVAFVHKLDSISGVGFKIPSFPQWLYVAYQGEGGVKLSAAKLAGREWLKNNSDNRIHPVKQKAPNALGVYDMIGNVAEWTISGSSPLFFVAGRSYDSDTKGYEVDSYEINHSEVKTPSLGLRLVYVPEKSK